MSKENTSTKIADFLSFLRMIETEYNNACEAQVQEDKKTSDYLHKLELDDLSYSERAKVATQLKNNRKQRREFKDVCEELAPIVTFVQENKSILNKLEQTLGAVRKVEKYHSNRTYISRTGV